MNDNDSLYQGGCGGDGDGDGCGRGMGLEQGEGRIGLIWNII